MAIRDTPGLCEVGDGVLTSNVLLLDEFHTSHTVVKFHPDAPLSLFTTGSYGKLPVPVTHPTPWVFVLREMQIEPGVIIDAWRRES